MFGIINAKQAQEALDAHKAKTYNFDQAFDWSLDLAKLEGQYQMFQGVEELETNMAERGRSALGVAVTAMTVVATSLARGADDQWSGQGNPRKRAHFDGKREAAQEIIRRLERTIEETRMV